MTKIIRTVKYQRGIFGQLIKLLFILFNLFMLGWLISYWSHISPMVTSGSDAAQAGAAIGSAIGTGFLFSLWCSGVVILGVPLLLTKGKRIEIEEIVDGQKYSTPQQFHTTETNIISSQPQQSFLSKIGTFIKLLIMYLIGIVLIVIAFFMAQTNPVSCFLILIAGVILLPPMRRGILDKTPLKNENLTAGVAIVLVILSFVFNAEIQKTHKADTVFTEQTSASPTPSLSKDEMLKEEALLEFNNSPDRVIAEIKNLIEQKDYNYAKRKAEYLLDTGNEEIKKLIEQAQTELEKIDQEQRLLAEQQQKQEEEKAQADSWYVSRDKSAMDDSPSITITKEAIAPVKAWLNSVTPMLTIRCKENTTDIIFDAKTSFTPVYGEYGKSSLRIRIDEEKASEQLWSGSTDNEAAFAPNPVALAKKLKEAQKLLVEFNPFNSGIVVAEFDLRGIKPHIDEIAQTCKWSN